MAAFMVDALLFFLLLLLTLLLTLVDHSK